MIYAELHYSVRTDELSDEAYAALLRLWPPFHGTAWSPGEKRPWLQSARTRLTLEEAAAIEALGVRLDYEGIDGTMVTKMSDHIVDGRFPSGRARWDGPSAGDLLTGAAVQIAVPDLGLMTLDEVTHLDDACTDDLQRHLDDGWRILAVCPPNAARRPDYILGRSPQGRSRDARPA